MTATNNHPVEPAAGDDRGVDADLVTEVIEIDLPSRLELVTVVRMLIATAATSQGSLHHDRLDDLRWVTSEAVTNAIQANHASNNVETEGRATGRVVATCEAGEGFVRLVVTDEGPGMPEQVELPDMDHPDRLQTEGGFGVPLMRELTRGLISYDSAPDGTTVHLEVRQH